MNDDRRPTQRTPPRGTDDSAFRRIRGRYPRYTRTRLAQFARRLRHAIYPKREAMHAIALAGPVDRITFEEARDLSYRPVELGEMLGPLWSTYWLKAIAKVPESWRGSRVDLYWDSRSEALLWLDGRSSQGLNIGRNIACLTERASGSETITFYIEVACNRAFGADEEGYPPEEPYQLKACEIRCFDPEAWTLYHDFDMLRALESDREPPQAARLTRGIASKIVRPALDTTWAGKLLHDLNRVCNVLDPDDRTTWDTGREILQQLIAVKNGDVVHKLWAIGHAHIDTAWLWPIEETRRKCQRSFANVVWLMDAYPEFKFACSQAYQYVIIEKSDPDLFARIRRKVDDGQWIPIGGSWVEPDCNLPSGESMCRQFLYGQRYFERTFGRRSRIFWNPDVFGYAGQLPQLMREACMDRFLTQKLSWNRFTAPPHHSFFWRGIDGSEVLTHFPPGDTYSGVASVGELRYHAANYKDADRTSDALYLFGFGDGGGGPNADMIERLRRARNLLGLPRSETRDPNVFFDQLEKNANNFATVEGELYFEYHRGTYTSQAEVKRLNRLIEGKLQTLEYLLVAANLAQKPVPSRTDVEELWRVLLTNQFHDILPGSSINEVYLRTRKELSDLSDEVDGRIEILLASLSNHASDERIPINPTAFPRAELVQTTDGHLRYVEAAAFSAGRTGDAEDRVFLVENENGDVRLENGYLAALLSQRGALRSLAHLASGREALAEEGNRFVLYDDRPTEYEAWDIDPYALETGQETSPATQATILARGPLRAEVRFERKIGKKSLMTQIVRLDTGSRRLEFDTVIDWRERKTLLKALFPLAPRAPRATFETMMGAVERPTHANTDADLAQFEVPGHRWADLSEPGFGVSLLSDSRYGYSCFGSVMGLSLLRGSEEPDEHADIGVHRFRYALYPHDGDWRKGGTVAEALRFNRPVIWAGCASADILASPLLSCDARNVVIDTVKPAEDGEGFVVRLYESEGSATQAVLSFGIPVRQVLLSNTLEDWLSQLTGGETGYALDLHPFQIVTLRVLAG